MEPDGIDARVRQGLPCYVHNPNKLPAETALARVPHGPQLVREAVEDWAYFAPLLARLFPDLAGSAGRIDSPLLNPGPDFGSRFGGCHSVYIKADHLLPVTGTIKARGGVYEVLTHARRLAIDAQLLSPKGSSLALLEREVRDFFATHCVVTGSTGNLGYSVGLIATSLGFRSEVHMSADAKLWKIERLRRLGVKVHTHEGDFSSAVAVAREVASRSPDSYFVDDEDSVSLFKGYAAAAHDLRAQLHAAGIEVSEANPLAVYLPCGVGGAPGGVTFGLKSIWGDNVHCVLVEPVASPAALVQSLVGLGRRVSAYDFGLDNRTIADGLAVPSASLFAIKYISVLASGFATVDDEQLLSWVNDLWRMERLRLEPSAAAGFAALEMMCGLAEKPDWSGAATHVVWTTGGSQLPEEEFTALLR